MPAGSASSPPVMCGTGDDKAVFSLSELLFGLIPACVLPFLIRRIGLSKAHHMTLMTQPISAEQALAWGLVDAYEANSDNLLRKYLLRLRRLSKQSIDRYKTYMNSLSDILTASKPQALATNREVFSDTNNLQKIARYVKKQENSPGNDDEKPTIVRLDASPSAPLSWTPRQERSDTPPRAIASCMTSPVRLGAFLDQHHHRAPHAGLMEVGQRFAAVIGGARSPRHRKDSGREFEGECERFGNTAQAEVEIVVASVYPRGQRLGAASRTRPDHG